MKRIEILFVVFVILATILFFWQDLVNLYFQLSFKLPEIGKGLTDFFVEKIEKQITTPEPLRAKEEATEAFLTRAGVIALTNAEREKNGLPPLKENIKLDSSAGSKVKDMFLNQYFAHDSPSGKGVADLAEESDYQFIAIGENLALGNFKNDEALVEAWMDSPGHRANILNNRYEEIGAAVLKGVFEGRTTWLAVQHFGLSLAACPQPDEVLRLTIKANQSKIDELVRELDALRNEIRTIRPKAGPLYENKVNEYNALVEEYNLLVEQTKTMISKYNSQVKLFNNCLTGAPY